MFCSRLSSSGQFSISLQAFKMNVFVSLPFLLLLQWAFLSKTNAAAINRAQPCNPNVCKLPDCFCSGTAVPRKLDPKSIPQIIMMSFDDAINGQVYPFYQELLDGTKKNPNECNITATFFVSHEYTDYQMLGTLYHQRHEIADHTISHRTPKSWWKNATYEQWKEEIMGMKEVLRKFGNVKVDDVKGFRAPFLQIGGDNEFKVLHDNKFTYESSMPTQDFMDPPMWPYTLDYASIQDCEIPPCPTDSYPGLWEVPMVDYYDLKGVLCNMIDNCNPPADEDEAYELIHKNFLRHYNTTRAPFPMFMHAAWFIKYPFALNGVQRFLKEMSTMEDVWIVTIHQAIEWIKSPTTLDNIKDFEPWKCDLPAPPAPCTRDQVNVCHYPDRDRYLWTCTRPCPPHYPWTGNPDGN